MFRQPGKLRHLGLELSVSGQPAQGLTLVGGAVLMDPSVQIEPSETGIAGNRPIGSSRTRLQASIDNSLDAPAATIVELGAPYRFTVGEMRGTPRLRALNLFDTFAWEVRGNSAFGYNPPRQLAVRITMSL